MNASVTALAPPMGEGVVPIATEVLRAAVAGEIVALSVVMIAPDGGIERITSATNNIYGLIGALAQAQHDLLAQKRGVD